MNKLRYDHETAYGGYNGNDSSGEVEVESVETVSLKKIIDDARSDPAPWSRLEPALLSQLHEIYMKVSASGLDMTVVIEKPKFSSFIHEAGTDTETKEGEPTDLTTDYFAVGTGDTKTESLLSSIDDAYAKLFNDDTSND